MFAIIVLSVTPPEPEIDEVVSCDTEPCKNGADCVDIDVGEVACFCLTGFEGDFCEISECCNQQRPTLTSTATHSFCYLVGLPKFLSDSD